MHDETSEATKVAVIYYSSTGNVAALARAVAEGAESAGAEVRLRRAAETAPPEAINSNPAWQAHHAASAGVPVATAQDVVWADAVVFGTPTRFGNVSAQLKAFIDTLGGPWSRGELADKVYSGFTSTSTRHGGHESTLLALYASVHHFGGIILAPGYTDPIKFVDGNPYGTSHAEQNGPLDAATLDAARYQGRRVATFAGTLRRSPVTA